MTHQEKRQVCSHLHQQGCDLPVHIIDTETDHSTSPAKPKALKVNQVDYEAIQSVMERRLEESVLALSEAMKDADLAAVVLIV